MSQRLIDLSPRWITLANWAAPEPFHYGVSFLCPTCDPSVCPTCGHPRGHRVAVSFWPPIDPGNYIDKIILPPHDKFHKRVSGETFDTLTFEPSVGLEHWHGRIADGVLTP